MTKRIATFLVFVMVAEVLADPRTMMVLPIDGDADASLRAGITTSIENLAKKTDATVKAGATTFAETAAAVGCDPKMATCAESVRTTLAVDELIYGTAMVKDGQVTVVVLKKVKDKDPDVVTATIAATDPAGKIDATVMPFFGLEPPKVICPDNAVAGADGKCPEKPVPPPAKKPRTDRALGVAGMIGSGVSLIVGLTLWNEKSKKQDRIDRLPTDDASDFAALVALEDEAGKDALYGNLLVLGAIGLAAVGFHFLKRDRKAQRDAVIVTPAPVPGGAGVWITFGAR